MESHKLKQLVPMPIKRLVYKTRELSAQVRLEIDTLIAQVNPKPIIILGNQKSGTSAIAALLGEMTGASFHIDMMKANEKNIYESVKKGEYSFSKFIQLNKLEFSKQIVKEPNLTLFYDELKEYFPQATFVFTIRDPRDNIRSQLDFFQIPGNLDQMTREHEQRLVRSWPSIFDGRWLGLEGENYIEMLAARWNYTADVFLLHPDEMRSFKYEDFVQDKIGTLRQLATDLGLSEAKDISAKLNRQYQPAGSNKNVKWKDFFGDDNLARIERICGERMKKFGYPFTTEQAATHPDQP